MERERAASSQPLQLLFPLPRCLPSPFTHTVQLTLKRKLTCRCHLLQEVFHGSFQQELTTLSIILPRTLCLLPQSTLYFCYICRRVTPSRWSSNPSGQCLCLNHFVASSPSTHLLPLQSLSLSLSLSLHLSVSVSLTHTRSSACPQNFLKDASSSTEDLSSTSTRKCD